MRVSSRVEPLICKSNEDYLMKVRMQNESMRLDRPDSRVEPKVMAGLQTFMGISGCRPVFIDWFEWWHT